MKRICYGLFLTVIFSLAFWLGYINEHHRDFILFLSLFLCLMVVLLLGVRKFTDLLPPASLETEHDYALKPGEE